MWAITSYYNPAKYQRRYMNFRNFRKNLPIPLVAVELSFDGTFELDRDDADVLLQIDGGAILWQKERLLNLALDALPAGVDLVAWLDGDIVFGDDRWVEDARDQLRRSAVVQLFSEMVDLPPEAASISELYADAPPSARSFACYFLEAGDQALDLPRPDGRRRTVATGFAWAARKDFIAGHRFYDAMIAGSGWRMMIFAMLGRYQEARSVFQLSEARYRHYRNWAEPFHFASGGRIGCVPGRLYHLWHGDLKNRAYEERHSKLAQLGFDPTEDIRVGENGAWHWARPREDLAQFLRDYFFDRAEDGAIGA
jgi:hypothetical protein